MLPNRLGSAGELGGDYVDTVDIGYHDDHVLFSASASMLALHCARRKRLRLMMGDKAHHNGGEE